MDERQLQEQGMRFSLVYLKRAFLVKTVSALEIVWRPTIGNSYMNNIRNKYGASWQRKLV